MKILYKINIIFYLLAAGFWFFLIAGIYAFGGCLECTQSNLVLIGIVNALLGWGGLISLIIGIAISIMKRKEKKK